MARRHWSSEEKINMAYAQSTTNSVWNYWGSQTNYVMNCVPDGLNWSRYASDTFDGVGITYNVNAIKTNCARAYLFHHIFYFKHV
jgi:hypothetical protein